MGDFSANFHRPESGIHTVEGTISGSRAAFLEKKRQREQEEFEKRKKQITIDNNRRSNLINDKFEGASRSTIVEKSFKEQTIGLVTAQDFKEKAAAAANADANSSVLSLLTPRTSSIPERKLKGILKETTMENEELAVKGASAHTAPTSASASKRSSKRKKKKKKKQIEKKKMLSTLSFNVEEEEEEIDLQKEQEQDKEGKEVATETATTSIISKKDPTVDTSFLPDRVRDEQLEAERIRLQQEWKEQQISIKKESLEITYSYWDGSGHRRKVIVQKGDTIGDFLEKVRVNLCAEFRQMKNISATSGTDALLYVKEDLIIPNDITFYDLIVTKARGKSGPLFHFDVHDDIRVGAIDARIEKDESHPGKVVERRWYDRNKHIFPASRWELYDPTRDYGKYTIGDKNK